MLVKNRMTKQPVTVGPEDLLIDAFGKMKTGGFRRLPVIESGKVIGIITDRDLRAHRGYWEHTKVNGVMTEKVFTVGLDTTLEEAAQIMLQKQIGGLPVVDDKRLVGIISASDVLSAFLDLMGASKGGSTRIDFILEGEEHGMIEATRLVAREGGEVLGIGIYRDKLGENPICYLRLISGNPDKIAKALRMCGFDVLGVHRIGGNTQ
ncbi:MAG TPA: CBS domain-containing protein [Candidatus Binatia bacterium]|nr:CBS domain-containing protein [Candidatus Binatia bacterium]